MIYHQLPDEVKYELKTGWAESSLETLDDVELINSYQVVIDEMIEEGSIDRKTGKGKMKAFKKAVRKISRDEEDDNETE